MRIFISKNCQLGPEHELTQATAKNLAILLSECGRKSKARQLLYSILAVCRHALGPSHEHTHYRIDYMRALGNAAR